MDVKVGIQAQQLTVMLGSLMQRLYQAGYLPRQDILGIYEEAALYFYRMGDASADTPNLQREYYLAADGLMADKAAIEESTN